LWAQGGSGSVGCIVVFEEQPRVLRLSGDEDRETQGLRRSALTRALRGPGDLVVELAELRFADPSLMVDLAFVARNLRRSGAYLRLRRPQPQIHRLIEMVGLDRQPGVRLELEPSFA
jgi:anti-anti-sigma factor